MNEVRPGTFTLLIWEEIPETTRLVLLPNSELKEEDVVLLRAVHRHYMNATGTEKTHEDAIEKLTNALYEDADHVYEAYKGTMWDQRFTKYIVDNDKGGASAIEGVIITNVYRTGWYI